MMAEFATRRRQFKKAKLRWRLSRGPRSSLGWVPFKVIQLKRRGQSSRFSGKTFRVFERDRLDGIDWWLSLPAEVPEVLAVAPREAVGLDLALKDTVATSEGEKLEAGQREHLHRQRKEHDASLRQLWSHNGSRGSGQSCCGSVVL